MHIFTQARRISSIKAVQHITALHCTAHLTVSSHCITPLHRSALHHLTTLDPCNALHFSFALDQCIISLHPSTSLCTVHHCTTSLLHCTTSALYHLTALHHLTAPLFSTMQCAHCASLQQHLSTSSHCTLNFCNTFHCPQSLHWVLTLYQSTYSHALAVICTAKFCKNSAVHKPSVHTCHSGYSEDCEG